MTPTQRHVALRFICALLDPPRQFLVARRNYAHHPLGFTGK
jgi:hypothetical protein